MADSIVKSKEKVIFCIFLCYFLHRFTFIHVLFDELRAIVCMKLQPFRVFGNGSKKDRGGHWRTAPIQVYNAFCYIVFPKSLVTKSLAA